MDQVIMYRCAWCERLYDKRGVARKCESSHLEKVRRMQKKAANNQKVYSA